MIGENLRLTHFKNPEADKNCTYPKALKEILNIDDANHVYQEISQWPAYSVTPLHQLDGIAKQLDIANLYYKDEAGRFDIGSFKALGGAYAVYVELKKIIEEKTAEPVNVDDVIKGLYCDILSTVVVSCATDGNHGRSVAWAAKLFGCQCVIYLHSLVSMGREQAIKSYGAIIIRSRGNYDSSVKDAAEDADRYGRIIISDTSYEGYTDIPKNVALGYTVMLKEIIQQLEGAVPTHVFLQGGVGGLASAVCAYFWQHWGEQRPRLIVVEPEAANCLQKSAEHGRPITIEGDLDTMMAGLACGEVSLISWDILSIGCDDFMTIGEAAIGPCMRLLARGDFGDPDIIAGESAVAGFAAAIGCAQSKQYADAMDINNQSRVLVIGTEGDTDPELYQRIISETSQ